MLATLVPAAAISSMHYRNYLSSGLLFFILPAYANAKTNFNQCLSEFRNGTHGTQGGVDYMGRPVNYSDASGLTYEMCINICGPGQEPFAWSVFSQQFSSWLLPWVSLVSQLPFYGGTRLINLNSGMDCFRASMNTFTYLFHLQLC
jgi:hypothetical protein